MKTVIIVCQSLLGIAFIVFGLNGFLHFMKADMPPAGSLPALFMGAMVPSGWMSFIFACQLVGGILMLIGRTAPLGLCILGPIIVNILCFHMLLTGGHGVAGGVVVAVLWLIVLLGYRGNFRGIFTTSALPTV